VTRPLVIYGAGGHAREVADAVADVNADAERWELLGYLSDDATSHGVMLNGVPVLGGRAWLESHAGVDVLLAVGSPAARQGIVESVRPIGVSTPTLVHPAARVSRHARLGEGAAVLAQCMVMPNAEIGAFALLNRASHVSHDCRLGDYATLAPNVHLSGGCTVGEGCDVGVSAALVPLTSVGEWSIVGAGAVVVRELPANCTAVGVPARVVRTQAPGWHRRP